jgi:ribosomal protein L11 methyltransferase
MLTYTALTTLPGKSQAEALGEALEELEPAPTGGGGCLKLKTASGIWEVGGYFLDQPNDIDLALLSAAFGGRGLCCI